LTDDLIVEETEEKERIRGDNENAEPSSGRISRIKALFRNRKRLMVIIAGILLLMLVAGGLFFFFYGVDEKETSAPDSVALTDEQVMAASKTEADIIFEDVVVLEPFERIPLKRSSAMKLINLGISLELTDHKSRKMVVAVEERLRKIIQGQVREMTWLELRNPEGKLRLKYELLKRMNSIFPKVTIRNVYFTNFLMQ